VILTADAAMVQWSSPLHTTFWPHRQGGRRRETKRQKAILHLPSSRWIQEKRSTYGKKDIWLLHPLGQCRYAGACRKGGFPPRAALAFTSPSPVLQTPLRRRIKGWPQHDSQDALMSLEYICVTSSCAVRSHGNVYLLAASCPSSSSA
jgi:hypothetical protein